MRTRILLATLLVAAFCYGQEFNFKEMNTKGKQLMFTKPDSAIVYLKNGIREAERIKAHDTIFGDLYHLYGIRDLMLNKFDSGIIYFKKAAEYNKNYPDKQVRSFCNIAICYRNLGQLDKSIKQLNEILKSGKQTEKTLAIVYGELASNYMQKFENQKAINSLLKAIDILKEMKDDSEVYPIKQKLANIYMLQGNYEFAIDLYDECITGFKKRGDNKNLSYTYLNKAESLIQLDKLDEAKENLNLSIKWLKEYQDIAVLGVAYSKIGHIEAREGNEAEALGSYEYAMENLNASNSPYIIRVGLEYINHLNRNKKYKKSLAVIDQVIESEAYKNVNLEDRMYFSQAMADTYKFTGNYKKATDNYTETIILKDSIAKMDKENALNEIEAKLQNEIQREKNIALTNSNKALEEKISKNKIITWLSIIGSLVIIILVLTILRSAKLKNRLQKEALKTIAAEKNLLEQQSQYDREIYEAQKERIKEKQRELTSSALRMANLQDSINEIINKCLRKEIININDVRKELQLLTKQKDYWKQFETRFNKVHPNFNHSLAEKFDNLTKNDLEFCSLLKLNLSNKEIASLLQISHESVITKKYRIKKKMNIQEDVDFEKVIMEI